MAVNPFAGMDNTTNPTPPPPPPLPIPHTSNAILICIYVNTYKSRSTYSVEFAAQLASTTYQKALASLKLSAAERQELEVAHRNLVASVGHLQEEHQRLATRVSGCVAGALVSLQCLPEKLNPVIRPLMDCIKMETDPVIQVTQKTN